MSPARRQSGRRRLLSRAAILVALGGGLGLLIVSPFSSGSAATQRSLGGTLTVTSPLRTTDPCSTTANPDLGDGAAIVIRDTQGREVGWGQLGAGRRDGHSCVRSLDIKPMARLDEYHLSIGSIGPLVVTAESLRASGGVLDLRFGG
jgi:hypothetical protein